MSRDRFPYARRALLSIPLLVAPAATLAAHAAFVVPAAFATPAAQAASPQETCAAAGRDLQADLSESVLRRRDSLERSRALAPQSNTSDIGTVAVIEDDGTLVVDGILLWEGVVQEFHRTHADSVDILAIYVAASYPTDIEIGFNALAFEYNVRNDIAGIGLAVPIDQNTTLGISTQRLKSIVVLNDISTYGTLPTDLIDGSIAVTGTDLIAHEVGHMMSAYLNVGSVVPGAVINGGGGHWSHLLDGEASVLYSARWQDNLDGTFTALDVWNSYSQLDQYVFGMRAVADVGPRFVIQSAETIPIPMPIGHTVTGTRIDFTIQDIIAAEGTRIPDAASAQHDFRIAFALVIPWGTAPAQSDLDWVSAMGPAWSDWFHTHTDSVGTMDPTLPQTPVVADFQADVPSGNGPLTVQFKDLSYGTTSGHTWDFGDGSAPSTVASPVHTYTVDGSYTVTLTVDGADGPAQSIQTGLVTVGGFAAVFSDDFETDQGWTVGAPNTATTGTWERADPEETTRNGFTVQPEDDHSPLGTLAWVTGPLAGAQPTTFDVDAGQTTLYSPILDLSGTSDPLVSYARWTSNNVGNHPADEPYLIEITDNAGSTWTTLESFNLSNTVGYTRAQFRVADFVGLTSAVQFRFIASDAGFPSLVEAALDDFEIITPVVSAAPTGERLVSRLRLEPPRPSPFRSETTIEYAIPLATDATLTVYDTAGRRVRTLAHGPHTPGLHHARWNGRDTGGQRAAAGVYWMRLDAAGQTITRKAVLLR